MISLNDIYIATAVTNNVYKNVVKVMASSFVRNNPNLQLHVYCLNFDSASFAKYKSGFDLPGVVLHQVEYNNQYTDPTAKGRDSYRAILDCTGVKFKLANDNVDKEYFMWVDADTVFRRSLSGLEKYLGYKAVYGVSRTKYVTKDETIFNAGVLIFHKDLLVDILDKYTAYCDKAQAVDLKLLGWSDEHFIRDEFRHKEILPLIYNVTPRSRCNVPVICHLVGKITPWTVPLEAIRHMRAPGSSIKELCEAWLDEYQKAKSLLDEDFIKKVEE